MGKEIILVNTSVLIDYFRKQNKANSFLFQLIETYDLAISVITKLEINVGSNEEQKDFLESVFNKIKIIPLNEEGIDIATRTIKLLRKENNIIGLPDILIASTAIANNLKLATINTKDFKRIREQNLISTP